MNAKTVLFCLCLLVLVSCRTVPQEEVIQSWPPVCSEISDRWDELFSRMVSSGRFSARTIRFFRESKASAFELYSRQSTEVQVEVCTPYKGVMKMLLEKIANIDAMTPEEVRFEFGVGKVPDDYGEFSIPRFH